MEIEDFDQARKCYNDALKIDQRNYLAWYRIGNIYFKQEKFFEAENNFTKALQIYPRKEILI